MVKFRAVVVRHFVVFKFGWVKMRVFGKAYMVEKGNYFTPDESAFLYLLSEAYRSGAVILIYVRKLLARISLLSPCSWECNQSRA